ncbi:Diguanylate cyclase [Frankia sp. Hr75.2]|nr:Diguanylate cyclase [Frankia sp. Hr75.2]
MSGLRSVVDTVHSLRHPTGTGRAPRVLWCAVVASLMLLGLDVAFAVLLDLRSALVATTFVNAVAQFAATAACFGTARRVRGAERRWRVLIGSMAGGAMVWSLAVIPTLAAGDLLDGGMSPAHANLFVTHASLFVTYGVALAGLLSLPTDPMDSRGGSTDRQGHGTHRLHAITLLDCLLIVGSIILLQWGTVLAPLVRAGPLDTTPFLLLLIHLIASLILAAAVMLIASFHRPRSPATLALLGTGLLTYGLNTNALTYVVAEQGLGFTRWNPLGFAFTFLLIFLATLVPVPARAPENDPVPPSPRAMWTHAVLPYAVLAAAGLLVIAKLATGARLDRFEIFGMTALLLLALIRQMITLAENARLLNEVRIRERQLHNQAFHDPLTGLANRALFTRRLHRALDTDTDTADMVSVLFMDLDSFKQVNDTFGHAAGDELLKISAERLRTETRAADTVARLGGDEFAIILDGGDPDDPRRIGERLVTAIQTPCLLAGQPYTPRASLGLVTLDSAARPATPDTLLHQADQAMYAAKREQGGRLVIYQPDLPARTNHPYPGHS